jgi:hypothetical protein
MRGAFNLAFVGLAAKLPDEFGTLRKARRAEWMTL